MMPSDLDNQNTYWNRVAGGKTFTHPIDLDWLEQFVAKDARIVDFGCGYGRIVSALQAAGYTNVVGYDTAIKMIQRGQAAGVQGLHFIEQLDEMPEADGSVDAILLFAVLTCIPSNAGQRTVIAALLRKLRPGGILYVSEYMLQVDRILQGKYMILGDDVDNDGVFSLDEGVTLRHHTFQWLEELFAPFEQIACVPIEVKTMNGNTALAWQWTLRK